MKQKKDKNEYIIFVFFLCIEFSIAKRDGEVHKYRKLFF